MLYQGAVFKLSEYLQVKIPDLEINPRELLVLIGQNGCGKTSVAKALAGELKLIAGVAPEMDPEKVALVSLERQQQLIAADFKLKNDDALSEEEAKGIVVKHLISKVHPDIYESVVKVFHLTELMEKPISVLSGGEGRRVLIASALCSNASFLVLDTPYDALDVQSRAALKEVIEYIHLNYPVPIVLIVNRPEEIPPSLTKLGVIDNLSIIKADARAKMEQDPDVKSLLSCAELTVDELPATPAKFAMLPLKDGPLVRLRNINVTYDREIFRNLNFTVNPGEQWQIVGPNGAGKTTLLSFITGENPLVYANDVTVFGFKRGSGESIWDIKKYFGHVSANLHLAYHVSAPVLNVVLSGFYDSIGLYSHPGDSEVKCARAWLKLAGLESRERDSFTSLSFGQQRLVLIIRALVKNPPLLILDEPLQGLDTFARALVRAFVGYVMRHGRTSILFVSHHAEDAPDGITHKLSFIRDSDNTYKIVQEKVG